SFALRELKKRRSSYPIREGSPLDLFYWTKSLELEGAPKSTDKRTTQFFLSRFHELWIVYPKLDDRKIISDLVERMGLTSQFKAPSSREMDLKELLLHARAQVNGLDTIAALRTL